MLLFLLGSVWVCEFRKIFATTRASQAEFRDVFPKRSQFPLGRLKMRFYLLFSDLYFTLTQRCPECFESDRILAAGIAGGHQRKNLMPAPKTANTDFQWREQHGGTYHKTSVIFLGCVGALKSTGESLLT